MSFTVYKVTIQREVKTSDGAGGKVSSWVADTDTSGNVREYCARFHFYRGGHGSIVREEESSHNSQGAGVETRYLGYWAFLKPFPVGLTPNMRLVAPEGTVWVIQDVRNYDCWSLQADVEVLK